MRNFNLDQLWVRWRKSCVREASSAAARTLNLTQPAVSLQILASSNCASGVWLIERLGKQAHATPRRDAT